MAATIFYFGDITPGSTSTHRANALRRLGYKVLVFDPYKAFAKQLRARLLGPIHYRTGYRLLSSRIAKWVQKSVAESGLRPDLIWVNGGELFGPDSLRAMKTLSCPLVLYVNDDPTGGRDGRRFDSLLKALPFYDVCAVCRDVNVSEFLAKGARQVVKVLMSYDEIIHIPFAQATDIAEGFRSEVAFIGTWMRFEKRDEFLLELIAQGIPVTIWGDRWKKSPHFSKLESRWRGPKVSERDYVAAIQGAKICLGLLSKGNRDHYTRRSVEVPFAGGVLCAERTSEHQDMFREGVEAAFWSDATECANQCKKLLNDDVLRESIRLAGMRRVRSLEAGNEDVCRKILAAVFNTVHQPVTPQ